MAVYSIEVENFEELKGLMEDKTSPNFSLKLSQNIVNTIIENLNTKKRFLNVLEVYIRETDDVLDITVDRDDFVETLKTNLITQEHFEEYEMCTKIQEALDYLKSKK